MMSMKRFTFSLALTPSQNSARTVYELWRTLHATLYSLFFPLVVWTYAMALCNVLPLLFALTPYQNTASATYEQSVLKKGHIIELHMEHLRDIETLDVYVRVEVLLLAILLCSFLDLGQLMP
ncbi:hypothetical protein HD554DRAFT_1220828 [Boletus coccyginus]|nr:hypothetical protein HD554DRAFT_1220828 [Boletus coccyginus]